MENITVFCKNMNFIYNMLHNGMKGRKKVDYDIYIYKPFQVFSDETEWVTF